MDAIQHQAGSNQAVVDFGFELAQLRFEARHGWLRIYENPESVAEHTQRASLLGFLLACAENYPDPNLVCTMVCLHDMHETRIGDPDIIQKKYMKIDGRAALADQVKGLGKAGELMFEMWLDVEEGRTPAGIIAKDAEILEMALTARELIVGGRADAEEWIKTIRPRLKTASAQELLYVIVVSDPSAWWKRICK